MGPGTAVEASRSVLTSLSLRFDAVEDRIVLRLVADDAEQWLQLTRRVCMQWRLDLQTLVDASAQVPQRLNPAVRASISSVHHRAMAAQATLRKLPVVERLPPAGIQNLVSGIACGKRRSDGRWIVRFTTREGRDWTVLLTSESLHGLVEVLNAQVQAANWALAPMPLQALAPQGSDRSPLH